MKDTGPIQGRERRSRIRVQLLELIAVFRKRTGVAADPGNRLAPADGTIAHATWAQRFAVPQRCGERYLGASVNAAGNQRCDIDRVGDRPRRSPKPRGTVHQRNKLCFPNGQSSRMVVRQQREDSRSNLRMQRTVWAVTPRACARVAPTHPAADPVRWTGRTSVQVLSPRPSLVDEVSEVARDRRACRSWRIEAANS